MRLYRKFIQNKCSLIVKRDVYDFIVETTRESPNVETGGILMGFDFESFHVNVTHASLPGPNAIQTPTKFIRDTSYCTEILNENYKLYGVDYIGEWHSHICQIRGMSCGDYITLGSILCDKDYDFKSFAVIVAVFNHNKIELVGYISSNNIVCKAEIIIE